MQKFLCRNITICNLQANWQMPITRGWSTLPRQPLSLTLWRVITQQIPTITCWLRTVKKILKPDNNDNVNLYFTSYICILIDIINIVPTLYLFPFLFGAVSRILIWCYRSMSRYFARILFVYLQRNVLCEWHGVAWCLYRPHPVNIQLYRLFYRGGLLR